MSDLARQAELEKLARLLGTEIASLSFLADEDSERLRIIREGVTEALFQEFRPVFSRIASLAGFLPLSIAAKVARRALGPALSGRLAGEMAPRRAIDMAAKLPDEFLADTCLQMEPQRAQALVAEFPVDRSIAVTHIMLARGEYIAMSRFVDVLPRETLLATADAIDDPADLLRIGVFVENSDQLDVVIGHMSPEGRDSLVTAAAANDLWAAVMTAIQFIGRESRIALSRQALAHDEATLDSLIRATASHDLWPELLAIGAELIDQPSTQLTSLPVFEEHAIIESLLESVQANDLWSAIDAPLSTMPMPPLARMLALAVDTDPEALSRLAACDLSAGAKDNLSAAAASLDDDVRARAVEACGDSALATAIAPLA